MIEDLEDLRPCFTASAAVAGLAKLVRHERFPRHQTVLVNVTGADRDVVPDRSAVRLLVRSGEGWVPEDGQ